MGSKPKISYKREHDPIDFSIGDVLYYKTGDSEMLVMCLGDGSIPGTFRAMVIEEHDKSPLKMGYGYTFQAARCLYKRFHGKLTLEFD